MYKQVETQKEATLHNGVALLPIATLKDDSGGVAHIWVDDHCYQIGLEKKDWVSPENKERFVTPITHIFPEAFLVLKNLPDLPYP